MNRTEVIVEILRNTDPQDLPKVCQTNKLFSDICNDPNNQKMIVKEKIPHMINRIQKLGLNFPLDFKFYILADRYYQYLNDDELRLFYLLDNGLSLDKWLNSSATTHGERWRVGNMLATSSEDRAFHFITNQTLVEAALYVFQQENINLPEGVQFWVKGDKYPFNSSYYVYRSMKIYIICVYLAILYRKNQSINFLDVHGTEKKSVAYMSTPRYKIVFFDDVDYSLLDNTGDIYADNFDFYLLQLLHILLTVHENNIIYGDEYQWDSLFIYAVRNNDMWRGQKLKDADFWAYRIGITMIYFPRGDSILKFIPNSSALKKSYPRINDQSEFGPPGLYPEPFESEEEIQSFSLRRTLNIIVNLFTSLFLNNTPLFQKFNRLFSRRTKEYDSFSMNTIKIALQSPVLFGDYMYPPALTPTSKVIILGEI